MDRGEWVTVTGFTVVPSVTGVTKPPPAQRGAVPKGPQPMSPAGLAPSLPSAPGAPALGAAVVARANPAPYGWQAYVVRPADTLSEIALRTRTTTGTLI